MHIPEFSLVVIVGSTASGKQEFISRNFQTNEIFLLGADDLYEKLSQRLAAMELTVIDMSDANEDQWQLIAKAAKRTYTQLIGIVLNKETSLPTSKGFSIDEQVNIREAKAQLRRVGADINHVFDSPNQIELVNVIRERMPSDFREHRGPFDIIGDVHGCYDELVELLKRLGYDIETAWEEQQIQRIEVTPPEGRTLVFVGDLVDRGPKIAEVLALAMNMVGAGTALCVPGNHDDKLMRALKGRKVKIAHGLAESLDQVRKMPSHFQEKVRDFIENLPSHLVLDDGRLVVAHAGLRESMHGRDTDAVRDFALYGATTGKLDSYGLPVRLAWAKDYDGTARVVYGHTPIPRHSWINNTLNIDTGCVFGGALSALRYPEFTLHSVRAEREYAVSARPFVLELDAGPDL